MEWILIGLITAIIGGSSFVVNALLDNAVPMAFYAEKYMTTAMGGSAALDFSAIANLFFGFGVSLIVLKFLKNGFEVYTLWQAGDPDQDPLNLIAGFIKALAIAVCFPFLYSFLVDVMSELIDQVLAQIGGLTGQRSVADFIIHLISNSIFQAIAGLVLIICYVILYISFLMRGIEMLVLRLGVPIACVGLIDSDRGVFAPYMKKFFQNAATVLVQISLTKLSLTVLVLGNMVYAIAIAFAAIKTPRFLSEFLLASGGGGITNTAYHTSRLFQMARGVLTRGG